MFIMSNKSKNKVTGICTTSLESIDMFPETPESGALEEGGNFKLY